MIAPGGELACRQNADSGEFVCDPPPANAAPAQPLTHYAGTYASNYYGSAEIRAADKTLKLRIGPQGAVFELLREGQRVEFTPEDSGQGPRAGDVRLIES